MQFRAGSSIRGSGGTLHPAAQLIADPRYDDWTIDFDVAVARVSVMFLQTLIFNKTSLNWVKIRLMREEIWFTI